MKHKRMITLLLVLAMLLGILPVTAAAAEVPAGAVTVTSPDSVGAASISVWLDGGVPYYQVSYNGSVMIEPSKLGLETSLGDFTSGLTMGTVTTSSGNFTWSPVVGEQAKYRDWCNAASIPLTKDEKTLTLELRAYPEGVAFRYVLPQSTQEYLVLKEGTQLIFPVGTKASLHLGGHQTVPQVYDVENLPDSYYKRPITMKYANGSLLTFCEANLDNYCEIILNRDSAPRSMQFLMSSGVTVKSGSPEATPWRTLVMGSTETELAAHNYLPMNLNEAPTGDFSWVKAGGCLMMGGSLRTENVKAQVDNCKKAGIKYILLDSGWYGSEYDRRCDPRLDPLMLGDDENSKLLKKYITGYGVFDSETNFEEGKKGFAMYGTLDGKEYRGVKGAYDNGTEKERSCHTNINIPEVCKYANDNGVGILLYVNGVFLPDSEGANGTARFTVDALFKCFEDWGVKGVKPGFVNVAQQQYEAYMQEVVEAAASHKLVLTVHDEWVPTGIERTYPNLLTTEGILGDEGIGRESDGQIPQDIATLFTRTIQGPTDHTYCYPGKATKAYALASPLMFRSGLNCLYWYTNPTVVGENDDMGFWQSFPSTWDESRYLEGSMYEYATYARRAGTTWYLGSLSAIDRTLSVKLDFLEEGKTYVAEIWADGSDAIGTGGTSVSRMNQTLEHTKYLVDRNTVLKRALQYGFGYAVKLYPASEQEQNTLEKYSSALEELKAAQSHASQYRKADYTPESWKPLQDALDKATQISEDPSKYADAEISQTAEAILNAIKGLFSTKPLTEAIRKAERIPKKLYTAATYDALKTATEEGKALLEKAMITQAEVDAQAEKINSAYAALVKLSATPETTTYLSDLTETKHEVAYNCFHKNAANIENGSSGKITLVVNGEAQEFKKGVFTHAPAKVWYDIGGKGFEVFEAYVGVDHAKPSQGNIVFRVYGDGELLYESKPSGNGSQESQRFSIPIASVKELLIETDDCGSDNGDWGDWADAKFLTYPDNSKSVTGITVNGKALPDFREDQMEYSYLVHSDEGVPKVEGSVVSTATVTVTQAVRIPGKAIVRGEAADGSTKEYTINFKIASSSQYLSDLPNERLTENTMLGFQKDQTCFDPRKITTYNDDASGKVEYEKGVGIHANASSPRSSLVYNIDGLKFDRFESWVGVDYTKVETDSDAAGHRSNVTFRIYLDGSDTPVWTSQVSKYQTPREFVSIDVTGVKTLRLQADPNGDQSADWASWADAKFYQYLNLDALEALYDANKNRTQGNSTNTSWNTFQSAMIAAGNILMNPENVEQSAVDAAVTVLENAIKGLSPKANKENLLAAINNAAGKTAETYCVPSLQNMQSALALAQAVSNNADATQSDVDAVTEKLNAAIASLKPHDFTGTWQYDEGGHWHVCMTEGCAATDTKQTHTPDREAPTETNAKKCEVCNYTIEAALGHQCKNHLKLVEATDPTCTEDGHDAYYKCSCDKWFSDSSAKHEITDHDSIKRPALDHEFREEWSHDGVSHWHQCKRCEAKEGEALHTWSNVVITKPATETEEGLKTYTCVCGATKTESIPKLTPAPTPVIPVTPSEPAQNPFNPNAGANTTKFPFADVPSDSWYYSSVKAAWENGLIDGVTANEFKPNATLTVAQTIKLAAALHQLDRTGEVSLKNGGANWYDSYVNYAVTNGIIEKDYANYTKAQMNAPVTRGEFVHIFHGAEEAYKAINTVADNAIPDVKATDKFAPEIYEFYRAGILTGSDAKGTFHSASTIKRSEAAAILFRMFEASARKGITLN